MKALAAKTQRQTWAISNQKFEPVAVYCRVSTEEQKENQNIQTQISSAKSYIELQGVNGNPLEIAGWYLDDGISGTIPLEKRPAGARLLLDAEEGKFKVVTVWKLDRLGRKPSITLNAIDALEEYEVTVRSITESFDASTPSGRLMLNMLASFAGFERETIMERSIEGTNRRAKEGQWLGGIVPYGYVVKGIKREARLTISESPLPNHSMSEADVVRLIYKRSTEDNWSCFQIAEELNTLGIPPAYTRDGREVERQRPEGKRKERTAGIWRPSRIRNLLVSPIYKGIHIYGKRSKKQRELISRPVPPIVSEEDWERAQQTLRAHMLFSDRNAKTKYLLRGLVRCSYCNLNYVGCTYPDYKDGKKRYYRCNGKTAYRGPYQGKCPSKAVNADALEEAVWKEIEKILLDPEGVITKLNESYLDQEMQQASLEVERAMLEKAFVDKQGEKESILDLYRRKLISLNDLENQLVKIANEEAYLMTRLDSLEAKAKEQGKLDDKLHKTEELLVRLQEVLRNPILWEVKRQVVELLVWEVRIDTVIEGNKKRAEVTITFAFDKNSISANCKGRGSSPRPA
ncbi:recombinase family protein [Dehalococcoidia bacterium]|nr:recombinase family protein [Dehalococcoidia bacterium]